MEEEIPTCSWESWINSGEHAEQVCFEGADHVFGNVALVNVRRYLLVFSFPLVGDAVNVGGTGFIIKYLEVDRESVCLHAFHDGVVCRDLVCISLEFERFNDDCVGSHVMCKHDVTISAAQFNWKLSHVVSEDCVHCSSVDVELVGQWLPIRE